MAKEVKVKSLEEVLKELEKDYGKGAVLNGNKVTEKLDVVSTGSIGLDHALGVGGIAKGKIYEIYGWESSGKSTLCQTIMANSLKKGYKCVYVDAENSLDREYAEALGLNLDDILIFNMDEHAGEGAYNKVDRLVSTGEVDLVVYDSYNALQPKKLIEGEVGDATMGLHARMLGQAVMKANTLAAKYNCTFIFIGQLREKIGVMYGSPETTQGGNALKFYSHVRLKVGRSTTKDNSSFDGDTKTGNKVTVSVDKNKLAAPFTKAVFDVLYGVGIDKIGEIIRLGPETEVFKVRAGVVTYLGDKYPLEEFRELLSTNDEFKESVVSKIMEKLNEEDNGETKENQSGEEVRETENDTVIPADLG